MNKNHLSNFFNGWIIGDFEPALLKTKDFEVGLKIHSRDEIIAPHLHLHVTEYNLMIEGQMEINGTVFTEGDIFVFSKGEKCYPKCLSNKSKVLCVKVPSVPSDKVSV